MVGSVFEKELSTNYFSIIHDYLSASEWLLLDAKIPDFENIAKFILSFVYQYILDFSDCQVFEIP